MNLLGSFWSTSFTDESEVLPSLLYARAQRDMQSHLNLLELVASMSRFNVPVFHQENWKPFIIRESDMNRTPLNYVRYVGDSENNYTSDGSIVYGGMSVTDGFSWSIPPELVGAKSILNRITRTSKTLTDGLDFSINTETGTITFVENPFLSDLTLIVNILEGNEVVDREAVFWLYRGEYDLGHVFNQFGYAVGLFAESSQNYKDLVNAVFDALVEGTSVRAVQQAWSAICDVPLARGSETVEIIFTMAESQAVVTDQNVYNFSSTANIIVAVGDMLKAGDPLTDALQFFDLNRGEIPESVTSLCVGPGLLTSGYFADLVFENKLVPLIVEEDVDGYTKVSFELGGLITDAEKFWDDIHTAGVAKEQTMAMLLDTRSEPTTQPTALALPAQINPLRFLIQNVLRNNTYLVSLKPSGFGKNALKLPYSTVSRKTVPPHTLGIVLIELDDNVDVLRMENGGTEEAAGYSESHEVMHALSYADSLVDPIMSERVSWRPVRGRCL